MRDVRELREDAADLGEEAQHLAGDRLNVVLAAGDDEGGDLVLSSTRSCSVIWFWMQFMRSTIL